MILGLREHAYAITDRVMGGLSAILFRNFGQSKPSGEPRRVKHNPESPAGPPSAAAGSGTPQRQV
jgi:hypothetical protein